MRGRSRRADSMGGGCKGVGETSDDVVDEQAFGKG